MNPEKWPWCELKAKARDALWRAGLTNVRELNELTDGQLLAIDGIGANEFQAIREVFLGPTGPRSKHGDVLVPSPAGGYLAPPGPANCGGTGRPSNEVRQRFRRILGMTLEEQIKRLDEICERGMEQLSNRELRLLMDVAAKYGIASKHVHGLEWDQISELMRALGSIVRTHVLDRQIEDRDEILRRIEDDWRGLNPGEGTA